MADQPVAVVEIVVEFLKKIPNGDWLYHPSWLLPEKKWLSFSI